MNNWLTLTILEYLNRSQINWRNIGTRTFPKFWSSIWIWIWTEGFQTTVMECVLSSITISTLCTRIGTQSYQKSTFNLSTLRLKWETMIRILLFLLTASRFSGSKTGSKNTVAHMHTKALVMNRRRTRKTMTTKKERNLRRNLRRTLLLLIWKYDKCLYNLIYS